MQPFVFGAAANGGVTFAVPFSDTIDALDIAPATPETFTVPADARLVVFSATTDFYAKLNGVAAVPGDISDGSAAELNPTIRVVDPAATISVISEAACKVTAAYYS